jgi:transposase
MLSLGAQAIYLYQGVVDMRKSFDGLSNLVEQGFPGKLMSGSLFVFVNRRRTMLKVLAWDEDGLAIWYKRLEAGTFKVSMSGQSQLSRRAFLMLLEGVSPRRLNRRFSVASKGGVSAPSKSSEIAL